MLERHHCRCLIAHSGYYSCEYCLTEGKGQEGGVNFQFKGNWDQPLRDSTQWREIAAKILHEEPTRTWGITAYSPLLDLQGDFDIVHDVPIDPFHNINEGLVKLAMTRLLRKNATSKEIINRFDRQYVKMRTFRDSPRQTRSLKRLGDFKGK